MTDIIRMAERYVRDSWSRYSDVAFTGWEACRGNWREFRGVVVYVGDRSIRVSGASTNPARSHALIRLAGRREFDNVRDAVTRYAVIHEFGHALGFAHEHHRIDGTRECLDSDDGGWAHGPGITIADRRSIMSYCRPSGTDWNDISAGDVAGLQNLYGIANPSRLGEASNSRLGGHFDVSRPSRSGREGLFVLDRGQRNHPRSADRPWRAVSFFPNSVSLLQPRVLMGGGRRIPTAPNAAVQSRTGNTHLSYFAGGEWSGLYGGYLKSPSLIMSDRAIRAAIGTYDWYNLFKIGTVIREIDLIPGGSPHILVDFLLTPGDGDSFTSGFILIPKSGVGAPYIYSPTTATYGSGLGYTSTVEVIDATGDQPAKIYVGHPYAETNSGGGTLQIFHVDIGDRSLRPTYELPAREQDADRPLYRSFGADIAITTRPDGAKVLAVGDPDGRLDANARFSGTVRLYEIDRRDSSGAPLPPRQVGAVSNAIRGTAEDHDEFGASVTWGDFDGDPFEELAIGSPGDSIEAVAGPRKPEQRNLEDDGHGSVHIFDVDNWSRPRAYTTLGQYDIGINEAGDRFGARVRALNIDGRTMDELAVGVPGEGWQGAAENGRISIWSVEGLTPGNNGTIDAIDFQELYTFGPRYLVPGPDD
jgi:hypothetical protein